mgnify:FL=1
MKKIKINRSIYRYIFIFGVGLLSLLLVFIGFTYTKDKDVLYSEKVVSSYIVTLNDKEKFSSDEKTSFNGKSIESIRTSFDIEKYFDYNIKYDEEYYLKAKMIVYDRGFKNKVREFEQVITDKTRYNVFDRKISFNKYAEIKYQDYLGYAREIKRNFSDDSNMLLEIVLCSYKENEVELASVRIPLMKDSIIIDKSNFDGIGTVSVLSKINFINGLCFVIAGMGVYTIYFVIRKKKGKSREKIEVI